MQLKLNFPNNQSFFRRKNIYMTNINDDYADNSNHHQTKFLFPFIFNLCQWSIRAKGTRQINETICQFNLCLPFILEFQYIWKNKKNNDSITSGILCFMFQIQNEKLSSTIWVTRVYPRAAKTLFRICDLLNILMNKSGISAYR